MISEQDRLARDEKYMATMRMRESYPLLLALATRVARECCSCGIGDPILCIHDEARLAIAAAIEPRKEKS